MRSTPGLLLGHLPAIYHTSEDLRAVLAVLETVLWGMAEKELGGERRQQLLDGSRPLADAIASISSLFDAFHTPKEFIPWLAQWVALTDLRGLPEERQRQLLATIVPLYAKRGTKDYLEELLKFFTPEHATVVIKDDEMPGFVVGTAKIGFDSRLESDRPFWFTVEIRMPALHGDVAEREAWRMQWEQRVRQVIEVAKPAHTLYELYIDGVRIGIK